MCNPHLKKKKAVVVSDVHGQMNMNVYRMEFARNAAKTPPVIITK
jgi:hypothetical protein